MKTQKTLLIPLLLLLTAAPALRAQPGGETANPKLRQQQAELATTARQLEALESFVSFAPDRIASLDVAKARAAGFSEDTIKLAQEMVAAQNEMLQAMRNRRQDGAGIDLGGRESLTRFVTLATTIDLATSSGYIAPKAGSTNACGTFDNPVPSTAGPRIPVGTYRTRQDAANGLYRLGFHNTAWYVGTADFTRGRSYFSQWGLCANPRFRDQGTITSSFLAQIQYGECNPEVFSYSWPYWNWPFYCRWWHSTH